MRRADEGMAFMLRYENVAWYEDGVVRILDRRIYPIRTEFVVCHSHTEVAQAIADMVTQSAGPYSAAAMGMVLAAYEASRKHIKDIWKFMSKAAHILSHARPTTAQKMQLVVRRSLDIVKQSIREEKNYQELIAALWEDAFSYVNGTYLKYMPVGEYLASKISDKGTVMTQCFGETVIGTLLLACRRQNKQIKLICPETRPYFQGSRLTASVAYDMDFEVEVITDNMPAYVLHDKGVDVFTSAADVITMDGHIVNKIGTFQIALAAQYWEVPYYATGTPNLAHATIDSVNIERRDPNLVLDAMGMRLVMDGVKGYYPAFDITPPKLCDGVVTDKGIFAPTDLHSYYLGLDTIDQSMM